MVAFMAFVEICLNRDVRNIEDIKKYKRYLSAKLIYVRNEDYTATIYINRCRERHELPHSNSDINVDLSNYCHLKNK